MIYVQLKYTHSFLTYFSVCLKMKKKKIKEIGGQLWLCSFNTADKIEKQRTKLAFDRKSRLWKVKVTNCKDV